MQAFLTPREEGSEGGGEEEQVLGREGKGENKKTLAQSQTVGMSKRRDKRDSDRRRERGKREREHV